MASPLASRAFARSLTRCRPHSLRLRAQHQAFTPAVRTFTAGAKAWEKRYTEDHEWVELSADRKTATIGISNYAAKSLGDVVYVELPDPASMPLDIAAGDTFGSVESVKSASDILSPISGSIFEINTELEDKPSVVSQSPEDKGWLARINVSDAAEVEKSMSAADYKKFTEDADADGA